MEGLTAEEAAIYDRQLRVWGVEAQQRLRNSRVLILGCTGASFEVAKNLVLAGVGNITIADERIVSPEEEENFLVSSNITTDTLISQACALSLREMNPLVKITHADSNPMAFAESEDLKDYNSVLAFDIAAPCIQKLDSLCSGVNVPFASCTCRGVSGWIFLNPQNHEYIIENTTESSNGEIVKKVHPRKIEGSNFQDSFKTMCSATPRRKSAIFDTLRGCIKHELETSRAVTSADYEVILQDLLKGSGGAMNVNVAALSSYTQESHGIAPVFAILGGILANDIIKIVSKKGDPCIDKLFMYSILDDGGWTGF